MVDVFGPAASLVTLVEAFIKVTIEVRQTYRSAEGFEARLSEATLDAQVLARVLKLLRDAMDESRHVHHWDDDSLIMSLLTSAAKSMEELNNLVGKYGEMTSKVSIKDRVRFVVTDVEL